MFFEDRMSDKNLLAVSSSWNLDLPVSFKLVVKLLAPGGQVGTVNISSRLLAASWSLLLVVFLLIGNDLYNSGFLFFMFANALTAWYPTPSQFKHPSHPPDPSSYLDLIKNLEIKSTLKYKRFKKIAWTQFHHLHLQWKFKLLAGKFTWGNKAKHCWALSTNFWKQNVCWHHPPMFCLITSSKLSRQ